MNWDSRGTSQGRREHMSFHTPSFELVLILSSDILEIPLRVRYGICMYRRVGQYFWCISIIENECSLIRLRRVQRIIKYLSLRYHGGRVVYVSKKGKK